MFYSAQAIGNQKADKHPKIMSNLLSGLNKNSAYSSMKTQLPHPQIIISIHLCLFADNRERQIYPYVQKQPLISSDMIFAQRRGEIFSERNAKQ